MSSNDNNSISPLIYFIVGINIFMGLLKGVITLVIEDDFSKGFYESAGWLFPVFVLSVFIIIMLFLFGGGKNNSRY